MEPASRYRPLGYRINADFKPQIESAIEASYYDARRRHFDLTKKFSPPFYKKRYRWIRQQDDFYPDFKRELKVAENKLNPLGYCIIVNVIQYQSDRHFHYMIKMMFDIHTDTKTLIQKFHEKVNHKKMETLLW